MNVEAKRPYAMKNAWYVAALSTEVGEDALFHRKLLDTSVLIYRKKDGTPVAMQDRCPHRFLPLHMGKRVGDEVACHYHGLRFGTDGKCTHNPHGNQRIPEAMKTRSFPLLERYGFIWIWMGDQPADPAKLPDYSPLDEGHPNALAYTYMYLKVNFELIMDNVMDLSHIDHVHGEIISTRGKLSPIVPEMRETSRTISARWEWVQQPAMMIFANFLPDPEGPARGYFDITWAPPANIQLSVGAVQGDKSFDEAISQYDLHTVTPESENTTHYWFATRRNHIVEDAEYNKLKIEGMHGAFESEDGPVLEAVHEEMGTNDFFSLHPVLISNDAAAVKVRKLLKHLIDEEN